MATDEEKKRIVEEYVALQMKKAMPALREIYSMFFPTDGREIKFDWEIADDKLVIFVTGRRSSERN